MRLGLVRNRPAVRPAERRRACEDASQCTGRRPLPAEPSLPRMDKALLDSPRRRDDSKLALIKRDRRSGCSAGRLSAFTRRFDYRQKTRDAKFKEETAMPTPMERLTRRNFLRSTAFVG